MNSGSASEKYGWNLEPWPGQEASKATYRVLSGSTDGENMSAALKVPLVYFFSHEIC